MAQAHVAQEHHEDGHAPSLIPELEADQHGHEHGHAMVDTPTAPRDSQLPNAFEAEHALTLSSCQISAP